MKPLRLASLRPSVARREHPLEWLADSVRNEPTFALKAWFGGRSIMLEGQHRLFLVVRGEPWQGVLVCTSQEHHESLRADFPSLRSHGILKKWLYLPEDAETFERDAKRLVQRVKARDPRIGILPRVKKKRPAKKIRFGDKL